MTKGRKITDAKNASDGTVSHVKLDGNTNWTAVERAIPMAERGDIANVHVVHARDKKVHLRTNPDGRERNNLDYLADD